MRKIFLILLSLCIAVVGFSQSITNRSNQTVTVQDARWSALYNAFIPKYADTTAANVQKGIDSCSALIYTYDANAVWYRACSPKHWSLVGAPQSITFLTDSSIRICFGNGTICYDIAIYNFDTVINNIIQTFIDSSTTINNVVGCNFVSPNGLVVSWADSLLFFDVTAGRATINCRSYNYSDTTVQLNPGDPSDPRFDVIAVDTNSHVVVIEGDPATDPQVPQTDPASQLALTTILVAAGATEPSDIDSIIIFDEHRGIEWTPSQNLWTTITAANFDDMTAPYHFVTDIKIANSGTAGAASYISFLSPTELQADGGYSLLKLFVRLNGALNNAQGIRFYWAKSDGTQVSSIVNVLNGTFGFNGSLTGQYQMLVIPFGAFIFTDTSFQRLTIKPINNTKNLYIDYIQLQSGFDQTNTGNFILNQYQGAQQANFWVSGNGKVEGQLSSPNTQYDYSEKFGRNSAVGGVGSTALGGQAYAGAYSTSTGYQSYSDGGTTYGAFSYAWPSSISIQGRTVASGAVTVGGNVQAPNSGSFGYGTYITGPGGWGIGYQVTIAGTQSIGIGNGDYVPNNYAIVLGNADTSDRDGQFKIGRNQTSFTFEGVSRGVAGYVLTDSLGDGSYWVARPASGVVSLSAIGSSPNANGATITGTVLNLEPASGSFGGVVTTTTQTFAGVKTFTSNTIHTGGLESYINNNTNVRLGLSALASGSSASNSVAIGDNAATAFTGTNYITAIGYFAAAANVNGSSNTAVGSEALRYNTNSNNTAFGDKALGGITNSGSNNSAFGLEAGKVLQGTDNTAFANYALNQATTADRNVAIGELSMYGLLTGDRNVSIGNSSSNANTTGSNNVIIGDEAGASFVGDRNIMIGAQAGYYETTGNKLYISNSNTTTPLLYGKFDTALLRVYGRFQETQGADITSANNLTLGWDGNTFEITGATQINLIDSTNWINGSIVKLLFTSTPTIKNAQATSGANITILTSTGADLTATAGSNLILELSEIGGTKAWRQIGGTIGSIYTASNGLTMTSNNTVLGGSLTGDTQIDGGANTLTITGNTVAGDPILSITSTSTAAASDLQKGINISLSGANGTSTQTTYGLYSANTHTGTSSTNIAGYFDATSGSNNYAIYTAGGDVQLSVLAGTGSRTVLADANGLLSAPVSDRSVKTDIQPLSYGLKQIMSLNPVSFYYKEGWRNFGKDKQIGFIAQEVAPILPNSIYISEAGQTKGKMGYNEIDIVPVLVKAMQEQQKQIEDLKSRVEKLEKKGNGNGNN